MLAAGPDDDETWIYTERDLRAIAPPLTRIANRYDPLRAAAAAGDEILLASAVARYGSRNYIKRRRYLAAMKDQGPRPITGREPLPEPEEEEEKPMLIQEDIPAEAVAPPALVPKGSRR